MRVCCSCICGSCRDIAGGGSFLSVDRTLSAIANEIAALDAADGIAAYASSPYTYTLDGGCLTIRPVDGILGANVNFQEAEWTQEKHSITSIKLEGRIVPVV